MTHTAPAVTVLLKAEEVSKRLGVTIATLAIWRVTGRYDLRYVKCGRLVRYREEDIGAFIERRTRLHTSSPDAR